MNHQRMKEHWVCFDCRKMFRKPPASGESRSHEGSILGYPCPECKKPMRDMGAHFKPPRRNAVKMWAMMRMLAESGITFHTRSSAAFVRKFIFGSSRPNLTHVKDRIEWYRKNWHVSDGQRLLLKMDVNSHSVGTVRRHR